MYQGMRTAVLQKCVLKLPVVKSEAERKKLEKKCDLTRFGMSCNNYGRCTIE